jgi:hypothetical protein
VREYEKVEVQMLISTYLKSYYLENSVIVKSVQLFFSYKCLLKSLSKLTLRFGIYCIGIMLSSIIMSGVLTTRSVWYFAISTLAVCLKFKWFYTKTNLQFISASNECNLPTSIYNAKHGILPQHPWANS